MKLEDTLKNIEEHIKNLEETDEIDLKAELKLILTHLQGHLQEYKFYKDLMG